MVIYLGHHHAEAHAEGGLTIPPGGVVSIDTLGRISTSFPYPPAGSGYSRKEVQAALDWAVARWSEALGHPVQTPALHDGSCGGYPAIACAEDHAYAIDVPGNGVKPGKDFDLHTVLLHEVGHLLGVPHIEGDPLMNPTYLDKVGKPTPAAIALAKLHEGK